MSVDFLATQKLALSALVICLSFAACTKPGEPAPANINSAASSPTTALSPTSPQPGVAISPATTITPPEVAKPAIVATKDGWWIKVRKDKQLASAITLFVGTNSDFITMNWSSGEPLEFDVAEKFRQHDPLYIKAQSNGRSWFCLMYKNEGVKHFEFDNNDAHDSSEANRDELCNFSN